MYKYRYEAVYRSSSPKVFSLQTLFVGCRFGWQLKPQRQKKVHKTKFFVRLNSKCEFTSPGLRPCDVKSISNYCSCVVHLKCRIQPKWRKKGTETPVNWQLMETLVSQGRVLTLAPFCKSFAPEANNCKGGVGECVWVCLENICLSLW